MKKKHICLLLLFLLLSAACLNEDAATPTPFPGTGTPGTAGRSDSRQQVTIAQLTATPEDYALSNVETSGRYRKRPLLVCESQRFSAPASWTLTDTEGNSIAVGGFDREIRNLAPEELTMTVVGSWRFWSGPVGCGKEAVNQQLWYLAVEEILAPSPLARVTLTPAGETIADNDAPAATPPFVGDEDGGPNDAGDAPVTAVPFTPTPPNNPASTITPTRVGTATPSPTRADADDAGQGTPSPTAETATSPTPTAPGDNGGGTTTPTATPTGSGGANPTATAGGVNPTPTSPAISATATVDPSQFATVVLEEIDIGSPIVELLGANETNLHPISVSVSEPVTITAVGEPDQDISLRLLRTNLTVLAQINATGPGGAEILDGVMLTASEEYYVQIFTGSGASSNYCLTAADEVEWFPGDVIAGSMRYGDAVSRETYEGGIDYWCFMGEAGDQITITNQPAANEPNLYIGLHGPPDYGPLGDPYFDGLTLENFTLPATGMFMIGVIDFSSTSNNSYSLRLTRN